MIPKCLLGPLAAMAIAVVARPLPAQSQPQGVTPDQVIAALRQGVSYLKTQQQPDGSWPGHDSYPGGMTALCTMALLNSGENVSSVAVQNALNNLRALGNPTMTYATSLQTMVFSIAEPEKDMLLIKRNVRWLERTQIKSGSRKGSWGYGESLGRGDNSNSQFALLALHEAERVGVEISRQTWQLALDYWLETQNPDGSWGYVREDEDAPSASMTCAGVTSVIIASGRIQAASARVSGGDVLCCQSLDETDAVENGLRWLDRNFSVYENAGRRQEWLLYYLYGLERVGRLSGRRFFYGQSVDPRTGRRQVEPRDWYREGAEMFVEHQDPEGFWKGPGRLAENNPVLGTALSLLFLSKGRRPVVVAKLEHGSSNDWDLHPAGIPNLTRRIEQNWRRDLTWQTINIQAAALEDLLQSPVLFISGRDALELSDQQKLRLRDYVHNGGFIFAEACHGNGCNGEAFQRSFVALMKQLFPENALQLLPRDHPIWFAEQKVEPDQMRPLLGINACCRTSVVYCPQNLSCYWALSTGRRESDYPPPVADAVEGCLRIGANVIAYATNRELKDKLDAPQITAGGDGANLATRGTLFVPKLIHNGGSDDAPNALSNLLGILGSQAKIRTSTRHFLVSATDEQLLQYPIVFMHGRRSFRFSDEQRAALAEFLRRGGFILADSICASPQFTESFRREMGIVLPDQPLARIPETHPIFSTQYRGFDLTTVTLRDPQLRGDSDEPLQARLIKGAPFLEGIELDDRLAVVFSPYDLSCALENSASLDCRGYVRQDAARIGVNILLYALQQ